MKSKLLLATILMAISVSAYAYCYTHTYTMPDGRYVVCTTCCQGGTNCYTVCN